MTPSHHPDPATAEDAEPVRPAPSVGPLRGVRVLEVASHVFVPIAGAVLTEWGAEVIKVEHPGTGDPYRSLTTVGLHRLHDGVDPFFQSANRGKRSIGINLARPEGRAVLDSLLATVDVFATNLRSGARRRLGIEVDDIGADHPDVIYVRGSAFGPRGPDSGRGGFDAGAFWARSGMQHLVASSGDEWPGPPRPAFGDVVGGLGIAGAISAALYRRATTGEASLVDASLLATGMWQVQTDLVDAALDAGPEADSDPDPTPPARPDRRSAPNPLMLPYRTADDRYVLLTMVAPDRNWAALCAALGEADLASDPRFVDLDARRRHSAACVAHLDDVFARRPLAHWRAVLADFDGEWSPVQLPAEVHDDPQVKANGAVAQVEMANGGHLPLVTSPVQFDGRPSQPSRAPELGEHTEEILLELGLGWRDITALKERGAIL